MGSNQPILVEHLIECTVENVVPEKRVGERAGARDLHQNLDPDVASAATSSVTTLKWVRLAMPKEVVMATSEASRPTAISTRPMRGRLCRASTVHQRFARYTSNQALKSIGVYVGGIPI